MFSSFNVAAFVCVTECVVTSLVSVGLVKGFVLVKPPPTAIVVTCDVESMARLAKRKPGANEGPQLG